MRFRQGRLRRWITDEDSPALALFSPEGRERGTAGDWYGEHVGKWLRAAALAQRDAPDADRARVITRVIDRLGEWQEASGYCGTYAPDSAARLNNPSVSGRRTWDLWVHACLVCGLVEEGSAPALEIAGKVAAFVNGSLSPADVLAQGNHQGLSSAVWLDAQSRLSELTGDWEPALLLAEEIVARYSGLVPAERDLSEIGSGKIYQILWMLQGLLRTALRQDRPEWVSAIVRHWHAIRDHHLTPFGGPWGGVATHKEVFNSPDYFSPYGMVETCSLLTWFELSAMLWDHTGEPQYAAELRRTALNGLVGAADDNGEDFAYFTFPNGPRPNTYHWACCKSSGLLGLELAMKYSSPATNLVSGETRVRFAKNTLDHHGHEVFRLEYVCFEAGPYALAAEPFEGDLRERTLRLPRLNPLGQVEIHWRDGRPAGELRPIGGPPIPLRPYADVARASGAWRNVWFSVEWQ